MWKPSVHKNFRISNENGLTDLLLHKRTMEQVMVKYNENLTIVSAGRVSPNPSKMLGSRAKGTFLEEMKEYFDYVVMDTTPLGAVIDA